jgi:hypothetical protein
MGKRQPKPEPFSVAELEEIAQSPALQGFEKVLQYRPVLVSPSEYTVEADPTSTVEDRLPSTVEETPASTVERKASSTVEADSTSTVRIAPRIASAEVLWIAEGAGGVFTSSRIKRVERAQDALTHVEEAVYDALWGPKKPNPEPHRLAQMGYSELAKRSRVSKRSIQSVIDRLLEKRFIEVETAADIASRKPTIYRVLGYSTVLKLLRDTDRLNVLRTGRGVFYAHRLSQTVEAISPSTVEASSTSTVEASAPSTVEASSTATTLGRKPEGKTSSSVSAVAERVVKLLPIDDDAVCRLIANCRQVDPEASDDEIAYCAELWIHQNARNSSIRKPVAVMLIGVPKFFEPPATELSRYRAQRAYELEQSRALARSILEDPDASEENLAWARELIGVGHHHHG